MMNFYLHPQEMLNQEKNPANAKFNTIYDGTVNMETVLRAAAVGTKGHYYQLDPKLSHRLSEIRDHNDTVIKPDPLHDETWLGVEKTTGVTLQARQRFQISFISGS